MLSLAFTSCNTSENTTNNYVFNFGNNITTDFIGKIVDVNTNLVSGDEIVMSSIQYRAHYYLN